MKEAEKLIKKVWLDTFRTILNYIYQDDFRSKQILSIAKLNRKNKDGVPYYIVMIDKVNQLFQSGQRFVLCLDFQLAQRRVRDLCTGEERGAD